MRCDVAVENLRNAVADGLPYSVIKTWIVLAGMLGQAEGGIAANSGIVGTTIESSQAKFLKFAQEHTVSTEAR